MIQCWAGGCIKPATETLERDGGLVYAVCADHLPAVRPFVDKHGVALSISGAAVWEEIRNKIDWRLALVNVQLPGYVHDELAWDVWLGLFSPLIRPMVALVLEEHREG